MLEVTDTHKYLAPRPGRSRLRFVHPVQCQCSQVRRLTTETFLHFLTTLFPCFAALLFGGAQLPSSKFSHINCKVKL
jgi:hypothetical protein